MTADIDRDIDSELLEAAAELEKRAEEINQHLREQIKGCAGWPRVPASVPLQFLRGRREPAAAGKLHWCRGRRSPEWGVEWQPPTVELRCDYVVLTSAPLAVRVEVLRQGGISWLKRRILEAAHELGIGMEQALPTAGVLPGRWPYPDEEDR